MSYLRTIVISSVALLNVASASASTANLDQDFKKCASAALQNTDRSLPTINVANQGMTSDELDHSFSSRTSEYRMRVINPSSGKDIGSITCTLSHTGDLLSAFFNS